MLIEGTTRFLDGNVGEQIHRLIEQTVKGVCLASGAALRNGIIFLVAMTFATMN